MAKEITVSNILSVKTALGVPIDRAETKKIDMTGEAITHQTQTVDDGGDVLIEQTTLTNAGWCFVKNLDASVSVSLGAHTTANHIIKLKPGESVVFRAAGPVYGLSLTASATPTVEYIILED
jgi:hypothetical protein